MVAVRGHECGRAAQPKSDDYRIDQIDGGLPKDLTGTPYRIGPGRHQVGRSLPYSVFDGDGMVSRFALDGSSVHFRNRYVRTPHFEPGRARTGSAIAGWA
ncbi:hypothetical protein HLB23_07045 [Nocardia uniformis]|uniref:Dioxygenase n=1 Tax=Nocardia uniformis TaxID=53432 RepID=A0A849BTZ8_9NOCA|nr:carotenoid oxygenase family protein [Nocardia uniformis]NNH69624.1 hypothetical protein [Nocardia uniformis]